jgi:glycosyltransferase involved in cell wall biosynthesis
VRIAINASFVGEQYTGISTYIRGLIGCLLALGHQIVVYGSSQHIQHRPGVQVAQTSPRLRAENGSAASAMRLAWTNALLPLRLRFDRSDLLISPSVEGPLWTPKPQILVVHDLIPLFYPQEAPRLHTYYKKILPQLLGRASAVVAVSEHTRADLIREFGLEPKRVAVVYNGLRSDLADAAGDQSPQGLHRGRYFLFVGTFAPRKNLRTVVEAMGKVRQEIPESLVIVAYPDRWKPEIIRLIKDAGLSDRTMILSGLHDFEMSYLYRHATALFLLSEYEGFGYPPLEAMLTGTPAVVSDSTSLAEIVGDAALKIDAHDVDAAAAAMLRLSQDPDYRCKLQQAGVERARKFTWVDAGSALSNVLSAISLS